MASVKKLALAGAAAALLAMSGATPAAAAPVRVGSVFSGTVGAVSRGALLVERRRKNGSADLIAVDTDRGTVVSRGGLSQSVEDIAAGATVIVSCAEADGRVVLASKIVIREA